ncbi:signal transduction histidine kinase [Cohnella kolymensis]|uniref:Signal transduction histidine kinase n=1 Tax=Cohnella kolymensis TaxID=1590652 RepID=A0ABR5A834_9BACL|nr:hypothetical protein [Cohnella kolymensis]KIL37231.1 signal transduction histidine kinase [Cohnella kolymensis]
MDVSTNVIFIIAAFSLAVVLIMSRERIPPNLRRGLALLSILLVLFAFFLIVWSFFSRGYIAPTFL